MTSPVDISREACDRLAAHADYNDWPITAATFRALRAALDAAERERDEAREDYQRLVDRDNADYARGVRDAAGMASAEERRFPDFSLQHAGEIMTARRIAAAILALLPEKEPTP